MGPEGAVLFFIAFIMVVIVIRLMAGSMDGGRVDNYIRSNGGRLLSSNWAPFGKGWFGDNRSRIYEIRYIDKDGREHMATCKTSLFGGVYMTEDRVISSGKALPPKHERLYVESPPPSPLYQPDEEVSCENTYPSGKDGIDVDKILEENRRLREELKKLKG